MSLSRLSVSRRLSLSQLGARRRDRRTMRGLVRLRLERLFDGVQPCDWRANVFLGFLADGQLLCSYRFRAATGDDGDIFADSYQLLLWHVDAPAARASLAVAYDISWLARLEHQPLSVTECRHGNRAWLTTPHAPGKSMLIGLPSLATCRQCQADFVAGRTAGCHRHVWRCQIEEPTQMMQSQQPRHCFNLSSSDVDSSSGDLLLRQTLQSPGSRPRFKGDLAIAIGSESGSGLLRLMRAGPVVGDGEEAWCSGCASAQPLPLRLAFPGDRICRLRLCPCGLAYNFHPDASLDFYDRFGGDDDASADAGNIDDAAAADADDDDKRESRGRGSLLAKNLLQPRGIIPCDLCLFLKYTQYYQSSSVLNFNHFSPTKLAVQHRLSLNSRQVLPGHSHSPDEPFPSPCCCDLIGCRATAANSGGKKRPSQQLQQQQPQLLSGLSSLRVCGPVNYLYTDNRYVSYVYRLFSSASTEPDELPVFDFADLTGSAHCSPLFYCLGPRGSALEYASPLNWTFDAAPPASTGALWQFEELTVSVPMFLRSCRLGAFVRFVLLDECRIEGGLLMVVETRDYDNNDADDAKEAGDDDDAEDSTSSRWSCSGDDSDSDSDSDNSGPANKRRRRNQQHQRQRHWLELSLSLSTGRMKLRRRITSLAQVLPSLAAQATSWTIDNFAMATAEAGDDAVKSAAFLESEGGEILLEL